MLFNSYQFVFVFLPVVLVVFFSLGRLNRSWAAGWLALASIVFYGYWSVNYIPLLLGRWRPPLGRVGGMVGTFLLVMGAFILFRADSLAQAAGYYKRLFTAPFLRGFSIYQKVNVAATAAGIILLLTAEWFQQKKEHVLQLDAIKSTVVRALIYYSLIGFILLFSPAKFTDFIYIRF